VKRTVLMLVAMLLPFQAIAEGYATGVRVTQIRVDRDGRGIATFDHVLGGSPPGCVHTAYVRSLAFDTNTPGGRSVLAFLMTARAAQDLLTVRGTGSCAIYGNSFVEDWEFGGNE
jgi:hypothetical protein